MSERFFLFKGCLIPTRLPHLESSSRFILNALGVDAPDLPGATCCVEPIGLRTMSPDTWLLTVARMLAIAEEADRDVLTLCNGCYLSFQEAVRALEDEERRREVNDVLRSIGKHYDGPVRVMHMLELVRSQGSEKLSAKVTRDVSGLSIAAHSGCHILRPSQAGLVESPFRPRMLHSIGSWLGARMVQGEEWPGCCGGGIAAVDDKVSLGILKDVVSRYRESGANCILTPCPFCFSQFDLRQQEGIPVLYLSELIAYAWGAPSSVLGWKYHRIPPPLPI